MAALGQSPCACPGCSHLLISFYKSSPFPCEPQALQWKGSQALLCQEGVSPANSQGLRRRKYRAERGKWRCCGGLCCGCWWLYRVSSTWQGGCPAVERVPVGPWIPGLGSVEIQPYQTTCTTEAHREWHWSGKQPRNSTWKSQGLDNNVSGDI